VVGYLVCGRPRHSVRLHEDRGRVLYRASLVESHWRPRPSGRQVVLLGSDANLPEKHATAPSSRLRNRRLARLRTERVTPP
jgi:hypothetical protein